VCGRIALYSDPDRLARILDAQLALDPEQWRRSWNVGPTRMILGVAGTAHPGSGAASGHTASGHTASDHAASGHAVSDQAAATTGTRVLAPYRWGLVPMWAKDPGALRSTFNARAETVATKPAFRSAFKRSRLLVPVDAFYEWRTVGREKTPNVFVRVDGDPIVFAGLSERWKGPDGVLLHSATIITTQAGPDMDGIHDRMPVVLERDTWDHWLDPAIEGGDEMEALLRPAPAGTLEHHQVDRSVGNVRNDGPGLLDPVALF
jgi:putative SOS response-associated peptidase YedK